MIKNLKLKIYDYADDIFACTNDPNEINLILKHSDTYCAASGASLSIEKSELLIFGESDIKKINGIKRTSESVRHLGI